MSSTWNWLMGKKKTLEEQILEEQTLEALAIKVCSWNQNFTN